LEQLMPGHRLAGDRARSFEGCRTTRASSFRGPDLLAGYREIAQACLIRGDQALRRCAACPTGSCRYAGAQRGARSAARHDGGSLAAGPAGHNFWPQPVAVETRLVPILDEDPVDLATTFAQRDLRRRDAAT